MKQEFNHPNIQPYLMEFEAAYTDLGISEYSESLALDAIKNGSAKITSAFHKNLNEQLDRGNVKSVKLRAIHINRFYAEVYRFNKACEKLKGAFGENNE